MAQGSGDGPYQRKSNGANFDEMADPMAQIAARIGQLRGLQESNSRNPSWGHEQRSGIDAELQPLQDLFTRLTSKQDLEERMQEMQMRQQLQRNQRPGGGGMMGPDGQMVGPGGGSGYGPGGQYIVDPYKQIREEAIKQASNFLKTQNPFSSPTPKR